MRRLTVTVESADGKDARISCEEGFIALKTDSYTEYRFNSDEFKAAIDFLVQHSVTEGESEKE